MITERLRRSSDGWGFALGASLLILSIQFAGAGLHQLLMFNREDVQAGQWYRLLSCHWVHLDWKHAGMNIAGLWLLCLIDPRGAGFWPNTLRCLFLSAAVGLALHALQPDLYWYIGFSGVLHGLFVIVLLDMAWRRDRLALLILVVLMGKLVWEHYHGAFTQGVLDAPVIVSAHSYGAMAGLVYSVIAVLIARSYGTKSRQKYQ
jgi:rhomboid family GlyGly-CTERM serine protease